MKSSYTTTFYGTANLDDQGNVGIPQEARDSMGIKKSEKVLVFGIGSDMIVMTRYPSFDTILSGVTKKLEDWKDSFFKTVEEKMKEFEPKDNVKKDKTKDAEEAEDTKDDEEND
jgi:bifunctional DNA-binding transcriptional regulator/antitoxin component of YhaV-PrlF toxin-antitoxin module